MTDVERREAARQFYYKWKGRGREDEDARSYWIDFLQDVMGVTRITDRLDFEKKVLGADGNTKRIDVYIPETRVLIEQKSLGIALDKPQPGHRNLTPFEQAKEYDNGLPFEEKSRWIITSNFAEIWIYDMNEKAPQPIRVLLEELPSKYAQFDFLVNKDRKRITEEMQLSLAAGELVGKLYDALLAQYKDPQNPESLKSLNKLCVRLVFCLFAEDAGLFSNHLMFHDYLEQYPTKNLRSAVIELFKILNTPYDQRDPYLDADLAAFPYVNGGLFEDDDIEIPQLTDEIRDMLLDQASAGFNWSEISPTIFGAVFESTLNPETRRSGGMHYTSIENIHKVIDPLFLDELRAELDAVLALPNSGGQRTKRLQAFQDKLASLTFLDPAAGSGNFLTESYLSLRRMENEIIRELEGSYVGQIMMEGAETFTFGIKVSISQFYGIEINDFAVSVAKTAMWIAEAQMLRETMSVTNLSQEFLPLKTNVNIVEANALQIDWNDVVPREKLRYIMGNPPFVGASKMSSKQKEEAVSIFGKGKRVNSIDYVGAWYHRAAKYMQGTTIQACFVSTNSITQGEQVAPLWSKLLIEYKVQIIFAYRTFKWSSEAKDKAAVHCVIIGFTTSRFVKAKHIFSDDEKVFDAFNINPYLVDGPNVLVESRGAPLCDVPRMTKGNQPSDGGNLILSQEERDALLLSDSNLNICIRRYVGSKDFINNDEVRYCLWLKGIPANVYRKSPEIIRRLKAVREMRLASSAAPTRALAEKPYLFFSTPQTDSRYLCIPEVSSESRKYIPIGFMDKEVIASNKLLIVPGAELYHFGVLTSNVHMAWTRAVCGRMKSDYQYSGSNVYNPFPWPSPTEEQRQRIEQTAQGILDARARYPEASLADLYDELTMPPELRKAHQANDRAVMAAYGFSVRDFDEAACVAALLRLYQEKVAALES